VGIVCALAGARLLQGFLFEVQPGDPVALGAAAAVLALAALLAAFIPAVRATRMTPLTALRME
jgi:putative ABC transport system permease protein